MKPNRWSRSSGLSFITKLIFLFSLGFLLLITGCSAKAPSSHEVEPGTIPYQAGQLWKYETREGEGNSRVLILKVEEFGEIPNNMIVIHIQVDGLEIQGPDGSTIDIIPHMPFSVNAMDNSVTELEKSNVSLPEFQENYDYWRREFDRQEAGIFDETIKNVVEMMEETLNQ